MCIFKESIHIMRTNIEIDEDLITEAMKVTGHKTKKATVEEGLKLIIQLNQQSKIKKLRGKLTWEGDLEKMRVDQ
jgi:Arc/MetJ family transcription regulator